MNHFRDIKNFHEKFDLPPVDSKPSPLPMDLLKFRLRFMQEELSEYAQAAQDGDLNKQLDALVDLVYVALGTAYLQRFPFNTAFARVHAANMAKVRALRESDSVRGSMYDVVKPPGWVAPSHADLVTPVVGIVAFDIDTRDEP
jgi:predicted HAD superfamily Cof-like phosphohydrolase